MGNMKFGIFQNADWGLGGLGIGWIGEIRGMVGFVDSWDSWIGGIRGFVGFVDSWDSWIRGMVGWKRTKSREAGM